MEKEIVGQRIKAIRAMTKHEISAEGWSRPAVVLELENGVLLYPSRDDEGNDSGALFGVHKGDMFSVWPEERKQ